MHFTLTFLLVVSSALALQAAAPTPVENAAAAQWAESNLLGDNAHSAFSFVLEGKPSGEFLRGWKRTNADRELDEKRREYTSIWMDEVTGMQVRLVATKYADFPAVEWTVWLRNAGNHDTPLVENIQSLNSTLAVNQKDALSLHGIRGDTCVAESFQPWTRELKIGARHVFSPPVKGGYASGKSSDGPDGWPYWNLQTPGGGMILAVGWPGQWEAKFDRSEHGSLHMSAGQQLTHLVLKPGGRDSHTVHHAFTLARWRSRARAEPLALLVSGPCSATHWRRASTAHHSDSSGRFARHMAWRAGVSR
jgi:alpha-galactosidase